MCIADYVNQFEVLNEWERMDNKGKFIIKGYSLDDTDRAEWIGQTDYKNICLEMVKYGVENEFKIKVINCSTSIDNEYENYDFIGIGQFTITDFAQFLYEHEGYSSEEEALKEWFKKDSTIWNKYKNYEELNKSIHEYDDIYGYEILSSNENLVEDISTYLNRDLIDWIYINSIKDGVTIFDIHKIRGNWYYEGVC